MASTEPFSLYVHIPYCSKKCPYCDFNVHVVQNIPERNYTASLLQELAFYARFTDWHGRALKSIFFGGGTPSMFAPETIGHLLEQAALLFPFAETIEISLEANPEPEDSKRLPGYRSCGVNRVSIGAQSFQPRLLKILGRMHTAENTRQALMIAHDAGFPSISLDLIYAIPGQSLTELKEDIDETLSFDIQHFSAYGLTFEEGTPFFRKHRAGRIQPVPEDTEIAMAQLIQETAGKNGFERYEISNYARSGWQSLHNTNYWQGGDFLGIGAGAHSYKRIDNDDAVWGRRWQNEKNPRHYMETVKQGRGAVCATENIDLLQAAGEFMFLGLRTIQGISSDKFAGRFGKALDEFYPIIKELISEGLMEQTGAHLRLSPRGLLLANSVFVNFI